MSFEEREAVTSDAADTPLIEHVVDADILPVARVDAEKLKFLFLFILKSSAILSG